VARVKAILRRADGQTSAPEPTVLGALEVDPARRENAVRICISAAQDREALNDALDTLNRLLDDGPLVGRSIV